MIETHFVLYVENQQLSTQFYQAVLELEPFLNVPGMTEFQLSSGSILGLMPESGIKKLLGSVLPDPSIGKGAPRAELYLVVENASEYYERAMRAGATSLSEIAARDWGHRVAYCLDLDANVLALAEKA